ncbi:hypothetical protein P170DRAFT_466264 [Aspergillus steynii IBT 23096]|uniref:Uncharacterized protein n=1 Tax=Aspergillus steynii IBT 23096 TaxID=1392250 RepID=A0A2I2G1X8_9EURO|nr:uncharacterized protein P170DRAFT_466264 [Aspergillus steynii IBT 23096]PLB46876.1 hypothetical protein P170DRAFT_466264 [Aspergillus steynii IBT 23096]
MQLIHLTFAIILFILHCSAGPIAHFLPKIRELGPGDASAQLSQSSLPVPHNLQGSVSSNTDDALTVIPVTPSLTYSPPLPAICVDSCASAYNYGSVANQFNFHVPRLPFHGTPKSGDRIYIYFSSLSHQFSSSVPAKSDGVWSYHHHFERAAFGRIAVAHLPQGPVSSKLNSSYSAFSPFSRASFNQVSPESVATSTFGPGFLWFKSSAHPIESTRNRQSLSHTLSGSLAPTAHSSPTGGVPVSTTDPILKNPAQTTTSLTVGVVGLLPGAVSSGSSPSVPSLEATNSVHSHSATVGTIVTIGKFTGRVPTAPNTEIPVPSEPTGLSGSSPPQTQKTIPATTGDGLPTGSTVSESAQKAPSSVISDGMPMDGKHTRVPGTTAPPVSDPAIVIVTPGQSTSWTNTWSHVSDSKPTSSQTSTTTTIRPPRTIPKPKIPTGPTRHHHKTTAPGQTASHVHGGVSEGGELVTTIPITATVTEVVTVAAPDESPGTGNAKATQEPKVIPTPSQPKEAGDTHIPPSQKTKPTAETLEPATPTTGPQVTPAAQPTGAIHETLRGLQVVPVTPQGFITVTETKTETTTQIKTTTETETETMTIYVDPTMTMTASL